jgi:RNA-directed DNA polymerase
VGFQYEADGRRFWNAMRERLAQFALALHPDKTRLLEFGRYAAERKQQRGLGKPETFNFLGFTPSRYSQVRHAPFEALELLTRNPQCAEGRSREFLHRVRYRPCD